MKYLLVPLLLATSVTAEARLLNLGVDCAVPVGFVPSAAQPFELDWCKPSDGDDITQLVTQIASKWSPTFAVRAPSVNRRLLSNSIDWSILPAKDINFLEASNGAKLTIQHVDAPTDKHRMWRFVNVRRAVIGGPGLAVTFVGTHPGLGNGDDTQAGLLEFVTTDGSSPELADFRANVRNAHSFGLRFAGGASGTDGEVIVNRFLQVKVAGLFVNSGVVVNGGVRDVWFDPENLRVQDPFVRGQGWDGAVAAIRPDGVKIGCQDDARRQVRNTAGAGAVYVRRLTGGVTFEYGTPNGNAFVAKYIGDGPASPYRIRFKDYGFSGPTEITGLPAGVMVKKTIDTTIMKNDPLPTYGRTAADFRFIRIEQLEPDYGNGLESGPIKAGCAAGNLSNNDYHSGTPLLWRAEASRDGVESQYVTAFMDVTIDGVTPWVGMGNTRAYIEAAGSGADIAPGPTVPDRTFGHVLRATSRTSVPGITTLLDTNTVTGPGSWYHIQIAPVPTDQGTLINPNDNTILDTNVHGFVEIGANAVRTLIRNVNFTGAARKIILIGAGSGVTIENICAPAGSTIEGTGSVTYQGKAVALPFVIPSATGCTIITDAIPQPPTEVTVD